MEELSIVNARLDEHFGKAWNGMPIWRIVWSEEQFEKRLTYYTDTGIQLLHPEVRELPKYRQWIQNKWVLERLTAVPEINQEELTNKISYEPIYVFERNDGTGLPYKWEAAKFVIDGIMAAMGKYSLGPKYVDPDIDNPKEKKLERIKKLEDDLFGNETSTGDALAHNQAIVVPNNYGGNK